MLKILTLRNFRRHRDLTLDLSYGLNVIRGANEAGKSTLTEALAYALFGSSSLRNSLADTVTWGEDEKSLKVGATLAIDGKEYSFSRSKGGAEVTVDGKVYVSGQKEVSAFAARLIGADANTAAKLMMAGQGNLRGALEQGPKATAEMVEDLADFNLFETLLERMQEQLALGSDASARQRLEQAEAKLADFHLEPPNLFQFEAEIEAAEAVAKNRQAWIDEVGQPAYDAARQALDGAQSQKRTYDMLMDNVRKANEQYALHQEQFEATQKKIVEVDLSPIKSLQVQLEEADSWADTRKVFSALNKLNATYPEVAWEGTAESLDAEIRVTQKLHDEALDKHRNLTAKQSELQREIVTDTVCKSCGQPIKDHEAVKAKNAKLSADLEDLQREEHKVREDLADHGATLEALQGVVKSAAPFNKFLLESAVYVTADLSFVPPKLSWKGSEPPAESVDVAALKRQIAEIEKAKEESDKAAAKAEALAQTIEEDKEAIERAKANVAEVSAPEDIDTLKEASNQAGNAVTLARYEIEDARKRQGETRTAVKLAQQQFEQAKSQRTVLEDQAAACYKEIADLGFNNALLKKVRAARPLVADKLWNLILGAVSTMFSQMRGEKSIVSKGKDGFTVNGENVSSLSGSALDLLGLAIRTALTRTFIPQAPWLILDEPAAACSDERTEKLLGFIQGSGFAQTILVTHESASEAVADNLIVL